MLRTLQRCLASCLLAGALCLPAQAQAPPDKEAEKERRPPVPEHALAFIVTALVLTVVCMPSRK